LRRDEGRNRSQGELRQGEWQQEESYGETRFGREQERNYDPQRNEQGDYGYGQSSYGRGPERNFGLERRYRDEERFRAAERGYGGGWESGDYEAYQRRYGQPGLYREGEHYGASGYYGGPEYSERYGQPRYFGQSGYSQQPWRGQQGRQGSAFREGRREGWGEQLQEFGQELASKVKRAFRGPKGYKRSDDRIREDLCDRLAQADDLDPTDIEVMVSAGEVTLSGQVPHRSMKYLAEHIADHVSGVLEINNQLRVRREEATPSASSGAASPGTQRDATTIGRGRGAS